MPRRRPQRGGARSGAGRPPLGAGAARLLSVKVSREMATAIERRAEDERRPTSEWIRRAFEIALAATPADMQGAAELAELQGIPVSQVVIEGLRIAIGRGASR